MIDLRMDGYWPLTTTSSTKTTLELYFERMIQTDVCVAEALASLLIYHPTNYSLYFLSGLSAIRWGLTSSMFIRPTEKKIIIMGITTTTTTTTIVLVYSYYNYIPQFVFCSIIITKILLKIIPSPPQRPRFFSHHVRVQVQGPLFVIYISRWKIIEYFIFSFAGPIRAFTT